MGKISAKLYIGLFISAVIWYSFYTISPSPPKPADTSSGEFSAERAFEHIKSIADKPHPTGTQENKRIKRYIIKALKELGIHPVLQEGIGTDRSPGVAASVSNIIARVPGNNPQKTILLMAHYDSVPNGPGAGDDGSGVAAILEALRTLTSGDPLKNNIWVLFTDGEERGLLGAELFVEEYRDREQVDLVINVEARGTRGASIMFETSSGNAALIPHFAKATNHPVANSLTYTVYKLLPNDTDLSVMKEAGISGLNFAAVEGYLNYHTMQDNPANLSPATLQHHGENLLSNVRYFGNTNFNIKSDSDYVYFNNLTGGVTYYPASWSFPLSLLMTIFFIVYLVFLFRKKRIKTGKFILSGVLYFVVLVTGTLLTYFSWQIIKCFLPEYRWLMQGEVYNQLWYLWGFAALNLGFLTAVYSWLSTRISESSLQAGVFTIWMLISVGISWWLPTMAYLFTWPALFALLAWVVYGRVPVDAIWRPVIILCLGLLPGLFMISPYIRLVQVSLTTEMVAISMLLLLLLGGLCWPLLSRVTCSRPVYWSIGFFAAFLFCMFGAAFNSEFDEAHKKQNSLIYALDYDRKEAFWITRDHRPDSWTSQFLGKDPSSDSLGTFKLLRNPDLLNAPAPFAAIKPADLEISRDRTAGSFRHISIKLVSPDGGIGLRFSLGGGQNWSGVSVGGKEIYNALNTGPDQQASQKRIYYFGDLKDSLAIELVIPVDMDEVKLETEIINQSLPWELVRNARPRKPFMMPVPFGISDATIMKKTYDLDGLNRSKESLAF